MNLGGSTSVCPPRRLPFSLSTWGLMVGEGFSGRECCGVCGWVSALAIVEEIVEEGGGWLQVGLFGGLAGDAGLLLRIFSKFKSCN